MKKAVFIICVLSLAAMLLVSCAPSKVPPVPEGSSENSGYTTTGGNPTHTAYYNAMICALSDSAAMGDEGENTYYAFADRDRYDGKEVPKEATVKVGDNHYFGELSSTGYEWCNYFPMHLYNTPRGDNFGLDDEGKLIFFYQSKPGITSTLSKDKCVTIATNFMKDKIDLSQYTVSVTSDSEEKVHTVTFQKYINGFRTADYAEVDVTYSGKIWSYVSFMLGRIPIPQSFDVTDADAEKIIESMYARLDSIYKVKEEENVRIEYTPPELYLTILKDGRYAFIGSVKVRRIVNDEYRGALIEMLVILD